MTEIALPWIFLAGALSFLTPCVLPLVPAYLSFLAGTTVDQLAAPQAQKGIVARAVVAAVLFVLGFSTVFVALGATASSFGALIRQYLDVLTILAGIAIIVMGLHFMGLFRIPLLYREARFEVRRPVGLWGAYLMGLAFGFGWTPCIGPVLGTVLTVAAREGTAAKGAGLLAVYAAGLGLPFIVAAYSMRFFLTFLQRFRRHLGVVEKVVGGLLVLAGIAFLTGWLTEFSFFLLQTFPALGRIG